MTLWGQPAVSLPSRAYHVLWQTVDLIIPPHCSGCGKLGYRWCMECHKEVTPVPDPICNKCGAPLGDRYYLHDHCLKSLTAIQMIRSCSIYKPPLSTALKSLKYQRDIGISETLAFYLVELYNKVNIDADIVIPVPLSSMRYKERGYNQASFIAKAFSLAIGRPMRTQALIRVKETKSQVGLSREERSENVSGAFRASPSLVAGKNIVLIDDVTTTGSTLEACAKELKKEGAKTIVGLTIGRAVNTKNGFSDFESIENFTNTKTLGG